MADTWITDPLADGAPNPGDIVVAVCGIFTFTGQLVSYTSPAICALGTVAEVSGRVLDGEPTSVPCDKIRPATEAELRAYNEDQPWAFWSAAICPPEGAQALKRVQEALRAVSEVRGKLDTLSASWLN